MSVTSTLSRRRRIQIGRFGRVPVYLHPSWLLFGAIFVYFTVPLFEYRFGFDLPMAALWGLTTAVLTAFSVLIHELGHVAVARYYKAPVHEVEINIMGGHTLFNHHNLKPLQEALMSAAGPLGSFVMGGIFWAISAATGTTILSAVTSIVAVINVALGIFNLLPITSLDGGRILEFVIEHFTGKRRPGVIASAVCTVLLLVVGIVFLVATEVGRSYFEQPLMLIIAVTMAGFLMMNMVNSLTDLKRQEAMELFRVSTLLEEAPEFVKQKPLHEQKLLPHSATPEEVLLAAHQSNAAYLVVINEQNQIGGVIRVQRIADIIENDERWEHVRRRDSNKR